MNDTPLISIIVPVFNTIEYLDECINSLVHQTVATLEFIFVDNGSSDGSYEHLLAWEKKDPRIRVLKVEGGKQGRCRNVGLQHAAGQYIGFCDSDDWFASDMVEQLIKQAISSQAEITIGTVIKISSNKQNKCHHYDNKYFKDGLYTEAEKPFLTRLTTCYNKLYKKNLLVDNKIQFLEVTPHEDVTFAFKALYLCSSVACAPLAQYYWRTNPQSTTQQAKQSRKPNDSIFVMINELRRQCKTLDVNHDWILAADRLIENHLSLTLKYTPDHYIKGYLTQAKQAAGYLPGNLFKRLKFPLNRDTLGVQLYDYYQAIQIFEGSDSLKLKKYKSLSTKLVIGLICILITNIIAMVYLFMY